jgi:hypothetical protein
MNRVWLWAAIALGLAALIALLVGGDPFGAIEHEHDRMRLVYSVLLLALLLSSAVVHRSLGARDIVKAIALWAGLGAALMLLYTWLA